MAENALTENVLAVELDRLWRVGLVPVVRAPNAEEALAACRALVQGGLSGLEVTMTVPGAHEVIATLRKDFGDRVLVGAGTVTSVSALEACLRAGAQFIVTPICLPELVAPAHEARPLRKEHVHFRRVR